MTDGLTMNFGGVDLKKSEVASTKTKIVKDKDGKDAKLFMVDFKNGVKVAYKQSPKVFGTNPSIFSSKNDIGNPTTTTVNFVEGLELKGTATDMNDITVNGGSVNGIDISDNGGGDTVKVTYADADKSGAESGSVSPKILSRGVILTDKQDQTLIKNTNDKDYSQGGSIFGTHRVDSK